MPRLLAAAFVADSWSVHPPVSRLTLHHCPAPFGAGYFFYAPASHHWPLSLARLYPAFASPEYNVFPGPHCKEVREVLSEVSRLFETHPLQRSASASDKMDVRLPAWGLPSVAAWKVRPPGPDRGLLRACGILSHPGGAEAPPIRKRRGKRKRMEMQSLPLHLP